MDMCIAKDIYENITAPQYIKYILYYSGKEKKNRLSVFLSLLQTLQVALGIWRKKNKCLFALI